MSFVRSGAPPMQACLTATFGCSVLFLSGAFFLGSGLQAMAGLGYTVYGIRPMIKGHALTTHLNFFIRYSIFYIQQGAFFFFQLCRQAFAQCTSDLSPGLMLSASRINRVDKIGKKNFRVGLLN